MTFWRLYIVVRTGEPSRQALADAGLVGAVKTSDAKGVHVFVPIEASAAIEDVAAATRALAARAERLDPALATTVYTRDDRAGKVFLDSTRAGGATAAAAYSPRIRPPVPVSFPVAWDELDHVVPTDFTVHTAARLIAEGDPWADRMPQPQHLSSDLIEEGRAIPAASSSRSAVAASQTSAAAQDGGVGVTLTSPPPPTDAIVQRLDTGPAGYYSSMSEGPGLPCRAPSPWTGLSCPAASVSRPHHRSTQ